MYIHHNSMAETNLPIKKGFLKREEHGGGGGVGWEERGGR